MKKDQNSYVKAMKQIFDVAFNNAKKQSDAEYKQKPFVFIDGIGETGETLKICLN